MMYYSLFFVILILTYASEAYKILVISPIPGRSHSILGDGIVNHLSRAGHEITYITAFPHENPALGVKEIDVSSNAELMPESFFNITSIINKGFALDDISKTIYTMSRISARTLSFPSVRKVLEDPNEKFDVVIAEWMMSKLYAGLSAVYQCPYIWFSPVDAHWQILSLIDELPNLAYVADALSGNTPPFNFKQRLGEFGMRIGGLLLQLYISNIDNDNYDQIIAPIIQERGYPVPSFEELSYNASLVLANSHESLGKTMRLPANYKNIVGYHIDTNVKPLPADLKKLLDEAKDGLIYFSMGSTLRSKDMPDELKQSLLKMFGSLKQTILWKFEENLPNTPSNVVIVQWAPQQSILNHPNCKLFISHGGLLSITETVHFGKPIIGIPGFADQFGNIERLVAKGFAKRVKLSYTMTDDIQIAIEEILGDSKYTTKAKEVSFIYHHRPLSPGKELVHWVEHVVKTGGALHLRSPALHVPFYQKLYLDLIVIVLAVLFIIKSGIIFALRKVMGEFKESKTLEQKKSI